MNYTKSLKMSKAQFSVMILAIFCSVAYGQQADSLQVKKLVITTSVFDYFPGTLNSANFNIGAEKMVANYTSVYANLGVIHSYGGIDDTWFQIANKKTSGFRFQLEGRRYLNRHKIFDPAVLLFWPHIFQYKSQSLQNSGYYFALHTSYQQTNTEREEIFSDPSYPTSDFKYIHNDYKVERSAIKMHVKFGYQCIKSYGMVVDYSVGLGGQYINSSSEGKLGTDDDKDWPWNKEFDDGSGFFFSPVYQIRIGWGF